MLADLLESVEAWEVGGAEVDDEDVVGVEDASDFTLVLYIIHRCLFLIHIFYTLHHKAKYNPAF